MTKTMTTPCLPQSEIATTERFLDNWFDPIEAGLRERTREILRAMFEADLDEVLARSRYARWARLGRMPQSVTTHILGGGGRRMRPLR